MLSCSRRCSSLNSKSICLKSQNRLRDDVFLNFVRAAIDRNFAPIEEGRREGRGVIRSDRRLVDAIVFDLLRLVRQSVRPDDLEQEFADRLLNFRALDLENRRGGIWLVAIAVLRGGDDAELRHLERLQLDLDRGDLAAETLVLDHRLGARAL